MNTPKWTALFVALTIALFVPQAFGVVDQAIAIQNETNLVLSWPSKGYETYLVQYRPTLDEETPWLNLTNAFPANSTNRTTYVIPCCALVELAGTNGMSLMRAASNTEGKSESFDPDAPRLWVVLQDGKNLVPLSIYPHGISTNGMTLIEASWAEVMNSKSVKNGQETENEGGPEIMRISNGGCDCPDKGFFRVFHIPDFPASITNFVFDGPIYIPIEFKDYRDRVENIEVLLDNAPTDLAEFITLDGTNWGAGIYFDRIPNGTHQIQLISTLRVFDEFSDDATVLLVLSNLSRTITVDNQVTFTNWDDLIWNNTNYTFRAQLKNLNTDWFIDIYDAFGNYVNGTSGHTTNGIVEWTWDLTDTASNIRDSLEADPFFDPYITFESAAAGPSPAAAETRATPIPMLAYPSVGRWIFTYLDTFYEPGPRRDTYLAGVANLAGGPGLRGIPASTIPLKYGTNDYTQAQRDNSWALLKAEMFARDARNFYYYGHGWATGFGGDLHTYGTNGAVTGGMNLRPSKAFLTSKQVRDGITFNKSGGARPYRFVWLDGCSTANGDWPNAFGMNKATNSLSFYTNSVSNPSKKRPSVFVGWNQTIGGPGWGTLQGFWNCRTTWMFQWQQNWNTLELVDALENARNTSNWIPAGQYWGALRVYGYTKMRMNEYNQKTDWPGP